MLNTEIILENYKNYLLTDKTCSFVIKHLCSLLHIKFRTSMIFIDDHISFIHRDNDKWSSDSNVILWAYAIEKYKLTLHTKDTYSNNVYSKISDNAIILLNINGINPQKSVDDDYLIRYLTACFYFIAKHHILNNKNSWVTKIRVIEFAQRCLDNLEWRYQNKSDLNKSILATNSSNVNAVYNAKHAITLGTAPVNERRKITKKILDMRNSKFTQEEKDFIIDSRKSGMTIQEVVREFENKYGKTVSYSYVFGVTKTINLKKSTKNMIKFTEEEKSFIIDSRKSGMSVQEVVIEFENKYGKRISYSYVCGITKNLKLKKSIKNMIKFTQEEKEFVIEQRKSGLTIEKTITSFKDRFGKSISLGTVRKITNGVILPKCVKHLRLTKEERKFIIDSLLASKSVSDITCMFCNKFNRAIPEQTVYTIRRNTIRRNNLSNEEKSKSDRRMRKNDIIIPGLDISKFILNTQGKIKACPYNYMLFMKAFNINVHKSGSNFIVNGEKVPNIHPNDLRKRIERGMLKEDPITPLMANIKEVLSLNKNPKIEDIYAALVMCLR